MRRLVTLVLALLCAIVVSPALPAAHADIVPKTPPLTTPWTSQVSTTNPLPDYPRPQMTRPDWQSLNGEWQFLNPATGSGGSVDRYAAPPLGQTLPERILVPYPVESALSGIMRNDNRDLMFYRRTFTVPQAWAGRHVQLHFGAVDYEATVWVNGVQVATHKGGYDRFEADITAAAERRHQRDRRPRLRPDRRPRREAAARQAGQQPVGHLLHAHVPASGRRSGSSRPRRRRSSPSTSTRTWRTTPRACGCSAAVTSAGTPCSPSR